MKKGFFLLLTGVLLSFSAIAQNHDAAMQSITAAELRNHIYFLASDYLNGRVAATPEYEIAAQYVASQFAAAGLEPAIVDENGDKTFFQGVPFARTKYSEEVKWELSVNGEKTGLEHNKDFKIMYGSNLNHDDLDVLWLGYGISEPEHDWDDYKGIDVAGKIVVIMQGAPEKKGKAVLPKEIHKKYTGPMGFQSKLGPLFENGPSGVILVTMGGLMGMSFDMIPSEFNTEKLVFKGSGEKGGRGSIPSIYLAKDEFLNVIMPESKFNPLHDKKEPLKNYKVQLLEDVKLNGDVEIIKEDLINSSNVVGIVPGTDPVLKNEYIVIGAHLDHVGPRQGKVCNGADDNASGSSGVMEIAEAVAMNPCKRSVVFITYTAEEKGLIGSRFFLSEETFPIEQMKFNVNMDMIGRSSPKNEESRAHYVVTNKKYLNELESFLNGLNDGVTDFPLIFDNDQDSPGGSDHQSFISEDIPAFFFFSGVHKDLHQPGDDADKIDYAKAESICKLGYLIAQQLGNMDAVPDFLGQ